MAKRVFTQTFGVAGGLLERDGKHLLVKEGREKRADFGKWNHPAGWIDVGENPISAAKREVEEETGLKFDPQALLGVYSLVKENLSGSSGTPHHPVKLIFIGKVAGSKPKDLSDDVTETRWFTPDEILAMDSSTLRDEDIKQMVKDYHSGTSYPLEVVRHFIQT